MRNLIAGVLLYSHLFTAVTPVYAQRQYPQPQQQPAPRDQQSRFKRWFGPRQQANPQPVAPTPVPSTSAPRRQVVRPRIIESESIPPPRARVVEEDDAPVTRVVPSTSRTRSVPVAPRNNVAPARAEQPPIMEPLDPVPEIELEPQVAPPPPPPVAAAAVTTPPKTEPVVQQQEPVQEEVASASEETVEKVKEKTPDPLDLAITAEEVIESIEWDAETVGVMGLAGLAAIGVLYVAVDQIRARFEYARMHVGQHFASQMAREQFEMSGLLLRFETFLKEKGIVIKRLGNRAIFTATKPLVGNITALDREIKLINDELRIRESALQRLENSLAADMLRARREQVLMYDEELAALKQAEKVILHNRVNETEKRSVEKAIKQKRRELATAESEQKAANHLHTKALSYLDGNMSYVKALWGQPASVKEALSEVHKSRMQTAVTKLRVVVNSGDVRNQLESDRETLKEQQKQITEKVRNELVRDQEDIDRAFNESIQTARDSLQNLSPDLNKVHEAIAEKAASLAELTETLNQGRLNIEYPFNENGKKIRALENSKASINAAVAAAHYEYYSQMAEVQKKTIDILQKRLDNQQAKRQITLSKDKKSNRHVQGALQELAKEIDRLYHTNFISAAIPEGEKTPNMILLSKAMLDFVSGKKPLSPADLNEQILKYIEGESLAAKRDWAESARSYEPRDEAKGRARLYSTIIDPTIAEAAVVARETQYLADSNLMAGDALMTRDAPKPIKGAVLEDGAEVHPQTFDEFVDDAKQDVKAAKVTLRDSANLNRNIGNAARRWGCGYALGKAKESKAYMNATGSAVFK